MRGFVTILGEHRKCKLKIEVPCHSPLKSQGMGFFMLIEFFGLLSAHSGPCCYTWTWKHERHLPYVSYTHSLTVYFLLITMGVLV